MDYLHDRRPYAQTHYGSLSRDSGSRQPSIFTSHLAVDSDRQHLPSTPRSSSYSSPRPHLYHAPRRSRSQVRWPPPPSVESEAASLAREYRPRKAGEPDPPCRGSIDQDPLMIDVVPSKTSQASSSLRPAASEIPSQRRRGKSPAPPPIKTDFNHLPDFVERKPRPYNGTGAADDVNKRTSAEYLLSPERMTPTRAASFAADNVLSGGHRRNAHSTNPSPARSPNTYPPLSQNSSSRYYTTDESDLDATEAAKLRSRNRSSRYSFTKAELAKQGLSRTNTMDSSDESLSERVNKLRNSTYRSSMGSSRGSRPTTPVSEATRQAFQPPRAAQPSALSHKQTTHSTPDSLSGLNSRQSYSSNESPSQPSHARFPYSPPHSPKLRAVPGTASPLNPASRAGSRQSSRPTTPQSMMSDVIPPLIMFDAVNQRLQSSSIAPPASDFRSRNTSRLSSAMRADSIPTPWGPRIDIQSPSPQPPPRAPLPYPAELDMPKLPYPSLPYPDQQSPFAMPSEASYQFLHPSGPDLPASSAERTPGSGETPTTKPQRPALTQRHSCAEGVEQARNDRLSSPLSPTRNVRLENIKAPVAPAPVVPASCPRSRSSKGNNDWFTLTGDPTFNVCPHCLEGTVTATAFRGSFQPAQRDPSERIKCDFSRPWVRMAWILTLKQQRPDLDLLYAVSSVSSVESECPADEEQKRSWYGVFGDDDEPIADFYMCSRDRRFVEALFPSLKKYIDRVSRSAHTCTLDRGSTHFGAFLDQLVEMDETARRSRRTPDLHNFQELVQKVTIINNMPKCPKDTLAKGSDWHYLVSLPEFTVCPRCFIACVAPHIRTTTRASPVVSSLPLADQFLRTAQPLAREHAITRGMGSSCQLYSSRMRRIWASAVEDADDKYLMKKVRERKAVEMGVYETYAALEKMTAAPGYDKAAVKEELDRVHKDWKAVE